MSEYVLSACSTADLTKEQFDELNISYLCFHFELDGVSYPDDLGQTVPFDEFYRAMANGADTKTSQVNISEYLEYFTKILEQGKDILHVTLSSGLSGTGNSARAAAAMAMERFPERKVYVVDSLGASTGYGFLMDTLAHKRDEGLSLEELRDWAEANKLRMHHWFFSTDLSFYVKGGRISSTAGFVGSILGICPLLNMDNLGRLIPRQKVRTKKRVIKEIAQRMFDNAEGGVNYSGRCYMSHSACLEDAKEVAKLVEEHFPNLDGKVRINSIGTVIGSHTGPGTVALFFWGPERVD